MTNKTISLSCINLQDTHMRLDRYLLQQFPNYSRSYFQKLIKDGYIKANNKTIVKKSFSIQESDTITITFAQLYETKLTPQQVDFQIIDIQEDFLIINKPAGLLVHNTAHKKNEPSLVRGLLYKFKEFSDFNDDERPGIVHRIDKDTSGILIVARNVPGQIKLSEMFKSRSMQKTYLAVVKKHPDKTGHINFSIGRHPIHRHKMSHNGIASRPAQTYYDTLVYYDDTALVAASPISGRTHQIRVHLAAIGHGLIGDKTYGYKSDFINRQALHAWKISFEYKGKLFNYSVPVPEDFKKLLNIFYTK